ncbi:hypothetical protein C474_06572 [Halogeometricum pallidum JCM 14848]|uniref:Uncharacterized protein n=2 Tax=Halogeometricum TaxID=60846 RepID=M0DE76_HALPD|nr:2-isopropylmalate synthase [Halogeometricum pallidum]ELZ32464.1 hypothetical protein C474_06572 [Halogeometricum pallidum JCM 14848]
MSQLTVAVSEDGLNEQLQAVQENVAVEIEGTFGEGGFEVAYELGVRLEEGTVELRPDRFDLDELDVVYDPVRFEVRFDIPELCTPSVCIPGFLGLGETCLPQICLFETDPDLSFVLDLGGIVESEVSALLAAHVEFFENPDRTPGMTDLDAYDDDVLDAWHVVIEPVTFDIDIVDLADTVGNALEKRLGDEIQSLIDAIPGASQVISAAAVFDFLRDTFDIFDDLQEAIHDEFETGASLGGTILFELAEQFARTKPITIPTPFPAAEDDPETAAEEGRDVVLVPVLLPLERPRVEVTDEELIVGLDVGVEQ